MTGDDDPDDRRTYPWADLGGSPDTALRDPLHGSRRPARRADPAASISGDFRVAACRRLGRDRGLRPRRPRARRRPSWPSTASGASDAHRSRSAATFPIGTSLARRFGVGVAGERLRHASTGGTSASRLPGHVRPPPGRAATVDLTPAGRPRPTSMSPPRRPTSCAISPGTPSAGAAGYRRVRAARSPVAATSRPTPRPIASTTFTITGLDNARTYYFVVRALDSAGNRERARRTRPSACRISMIGWANLQWPPTITHTISADRPDRRTSTARSGSTARRTSPARRPSLIAQLGLRAGRLATRTRNAGLAVGRRARSTPMPATTTSSSRRCSRRRSAPSTTPSATRSRAVATGSMPTSMGSATATRPAQAGCPDRDAEQRHHGAGRPDRAAPPSRASPAGIELAWDAVAGDPSLFALRGPSAAIRPAARSTLIGSTASAALHRHGGRRRARPTGTPFARSTRPSTAPASSASRCPRRPSSER